jgi:nucleoside-diphosphate-sugar epimerase
VGSELATIGWAGMRVLIAGCGYVGAELGLRLVEAGHQVWGLRRDPTRLPRGIRPVAVDLMDPVLETRLPHVDRVVYAVSPDVSSPEHYHAAYVTGVGNLLDGLTGLPDPPLKLIFVSSTAVYGHTDGRWVNEETPPSPADFRGATVLEGEDLVRSSEIPGVCVRLGGIYGPGRTRLIERVRSGEAKCFEGAPLWSDRIHRSDAAGVLMHALDQEDVGPVLLGVDSEPAPICEVYRYVASLIGAPEPVTSSDAVAARASKRCSNRLLISSGYRFEFPTFREGYRSILSQETATAPS